MTEQENITILIALGGGLWAALNVGFTVAKFLNERRDAVIIGTLDKSELSVEHKKLILKADWLPSALFVTFFILLGIALVALLPWFVPVWFSTCWKNVWYGGGAIIFCVVAISWGRVVREEYKMMKQCAAKEPSKKGLADT